MNANIILATPVTTETPVVAAPVFAQGYKEYQPKEKERHKYCSR